MAEVSSLSLASSIDSLVQQFRTSQRKSIVPLENRKTTLTARLKVLADVKSKLAALQTSAKNLALTGSNSNFLAYTVSSTSSSVVTATASSQAAVGAHTILVTQLAKADTVLSSQVTSSALDIITAEGAGTKTFRITVNGENTDVNVTLSAGETNSTVLSNIATAINASEAGVSASVVSDTSTTSRLVLTSKTTGSGNAISLTDVSGTLLDSIGLTDAIVAARTASTSTTAGFVYSSTSSLDANFRLDGIDLVRESNSVSDALSGVTFELKGVQNPSDTPVTLTVAVDKEKIRSRVEKFIKDFNDALTLLTSKTAVDPVLKVREILAGDSVFLNLRVSLRTIAGGTVTSVSAGNPKLLSEIGIAMASDGTLSMKSTAAFDDALSSDITKVSDLFNTSNGIATRLQTLLDGFVSTGGQIDTSTKGTNNQLASLTSRIKSFDERLNKRVDQFRQEFVKLQGVLAAVARQQQMIQSLTASGSFF